MGKFEIVKNREAVVRISHPNWIVSCVVVLLKVKNIRIINGFYLSIDSPKSELGFRLLF